MDATSNEKPLVDQDYLLQKMEGKGGWTYAAIPEIVQDKHAYFGWIKVRGTIDDYEIANYHLMPMGNGQLFLSVKAEIRKKIGKNGRRLGACYSLFARTTNRCSRGFPALSAR